LHTSRNILYIIRKVSAQIQKTPGCSDYAVHSARRCSVPHRTSPSRPITALLGSVYIPTFSVAGIGQRPPGARRCIALCDPPRPPFPTPPHYRASGVRSRSGRVGRPSWLVRLSVLLRPSRLVIFTQYRPTRPRPSPHPGRQSCSGQDGRSSWPPSSIPPRPARPDFITRPRGAGHATAQMAGQVGR
jgi:hypothetical protein